MEAYNEVIEYELIDISIEYDEAEGADTMWMAREVSDDEVTALEIVCDADGIPMGNSVQEIKKRKQMIFDFYEKWKTEHPDKSVFNKNLNAEIFIRKESVVEAAGHSPRRYRSTLAVLRLEEVLANAVKIAEDKPKPGDKNQEKLTKMIIMTYQSPDLGLIKLTVGVRRRTLDKIQYGITAMEDKKNKAPHKN